MVKPAAVREFKDISPNGPLFHRDLGHHLTGGRAQPQKLASRGPRGLGPGWLTSDG